MSFCEKFGVRPASVPKDTEFPNKYRCVGIEIEQEYVEANSLPRVTMWSIKRDHSLRNHGVEFVTDILYPGQVSDALDNVIPWVNKGTFSWRAGIHIHIDARDLTEEQIWRMSMLYAILEPLVFAWEGNERDSSRFCVPWYNAPGIAKVVGNIVHGGHRSANAALHGYGKYSALNLLPLTNFGSVEFRHMRTVGDKDKIMNFIMLAHCIVEAGTKDIHPLMELSATGGDQFITNVLFGKCEFLKQVPGYEGLLWQGTDTGNLIEIHREKVENTRMPVNKEYLEFLASLGGK